ncbi:PREDICTED: uncharacterized protein LOC109164549 isoform X2 [Ipomoea nil]|uniref:uncharacterized protein LOC109164549 isoform X2 n=1 Tax=Ipomoea nil TaxID=35883 RepID=UPI000901492F|nr:PREDICTED: uncharacterized protein LOC109164549 isoform X2 [Ipomoea nil]
MGLKDQPEKENLQASSPTRGDDDDTAQSAEAHGGGAMEGFNDTSGEDLPPPITTSVMGETQRSTNILLDLNAHPADAQSSSPRSIDKRLQTIGSARIRKPLQRRSRIKLSTKEIADDLSKLRSDDDAAMRRPSGSSLPFPLTEQTDNHDPFSATNSGISSALVGPTSSTYNQGFRAQNVAGQTLPFTNIPMFGSMPPGFTYSHVPVGNRGLLGQNHLAQPFYGNSMRNMSPRPSMASGGFADFARDHGGFEALARGGRGTQGFQGVPFSSSIQPAVSAGQQLSIGISQAVMRNQFPARFGISQADLLGAQQSGRYQQYQGPNVRYPISFQRGQGIPYFAIGIPRGSIIHVQPPLGTRGLESSLAGWARARPRTKPTPSAPPPALPPVDDEQEMSDADSAPSLDESPPLVEPNQTIPPSLRPMGVKCWICNRDIRFTPTGPLSQPAMPPVVAVLSCHHVFHDHCLENITPEDQTEDPPCIVCAIREQQ